MKRAYFTLFLILFFIFNAFSQTNPKHVKVSGYYRKDGTYVQPHYRTAPNSTNIDNFSTKGNVNPYTGKPGWIEPDTYNYENKSDYTKVNNYTSQSTTYSKPKYLGTTNYKGQKVLVYKNGREVLNLCNYCYDITYDETLEYYWYTPYSGVQMTKGGSGGELLDGEYKFYNNDGKLILQSNYKRGLIHGDQIIWYENGEIKGKYHYTRGKIDYSKFTNDEGHVIEWIGEVLKPGSIKNIYTSSGTILESATVLENFKFKYKQYDEVKGYLESEFIQSMTELYYGVYKSYYSNGNIKFIGYFSDGFRDKVWTWYYENGKLKHSLEYRIHQITNSNGNLESQGSQYYDRNTNQWVNDGLWVIYKENGVDWKYMTYFEQGKDLKEK